MCLIEQIQKQKTIQMKTSIFIFSLIISASYSFCQEVVKNDTVFQLNNELIVCKVTNISELEIVYSYVGESLTNSISKKQVKEIHFSSGRIQKFSEMVIINGEQDWEKVILTTLQSDVVGLSNKGEVKGSYRGNTTFADMTKVKNKAEEEMKREAAKKNCHIIFIQVYNSRAGTYSTATLPKVDIVSIA